MKLLRCLELDMRGGARCMVEGVLLGALAAALIVLGGWMRAASFGLDWSSFTLGDGIVVLLSGMLPPASDELMHIRFPAGWLLLVAASLYAPLSYAGQSLRHGGCVGLLLSGSRSVWFAAKVIWSMVVVGAFWAAVFLSAGMLAMALSGNMSLVAESAVPLMSLAEGYDVASPPYDLLGFCFSVLAAGCALAGMVACLALFLGPAGAFAVTVASLVLSLFLVTPCLPGQYLMAVRTSAVLVDGVAPEEAALVSLVASAVVVGVGAMLFSHREVLGGSDGDD